MTTHQLPRQLAANEKSGAIPTFEILLSKAYLRVRISCAPWPNARVDVAGDVRFVEQLEQPTGRECDKIVAVGSQIESWESSRLSTECRVCRLECKNSACTFVFMGKAPVGALPGEKHAKLL